jgi:short-subunit dehydrogenase
VELRGAVVVVTGASSGFGELTALRFAKAGSHVVLAARRLERLESLAERIGSQGGSALPVRCDVTEPRDLEELRERVDEAFGRCDVLVNNAGIPGGGPFEEMPLERLEEIVRVNVLGVVLGTRVFVPMMAERGRGHIVNVASLAGRFETPGAATYGATKHAVVAFSGSLYYELGPRGILVTTVNPGYSPTEGFPQSGVPGVFLIRPDKIARTIVDVVRKDKAPEVFIPRVMGPLQAFRVLTPPLYRWGVRMAARRLRATPSR